MTTSYCYFGFGTSSANANSGAQYEDNSSYSVSNDSGFSYPCQQWIQVVSSVATYYWVARLTFSGGTAGMCNDANGQSHLIALKLA